MRILFILLLLPVISFCQTFEKLYCDVDFQTPIDIIEIPNGYLFARYLSNNDTLCSEIKIINKHGKEVNSLVFNDNWQVITNLVLLSDTLIFAAGYSTEKNNDSLKLIYFLLDLNLKIQNQITIQTNIPQPTVDDPIAISSKVCLTRTNSIIQTLGYYSYNNTSLRGFCLNKINIDLTKFTSKTQKTPLLPGESLPDCIIPYHDSDSLLLFFPLKTFILDKELQIVDSLPESFTIYYHDGGSASIPSHLTAVWYGNEMIISGAVGGLIVAKYNYDLSFNSFNIFSNAGDEYVAYNVGISTNSNSIYISGTGEYSSFIFGVESSIR